MFESSIIDVTGTSLDEWLSLLAHPPKGKVFVRNTFPTDRHRDEFLSTLGTRSDAQVRMVLRHFLVCAGSNPMDAIHAAGVIALRLPATEHNRRLVLHRATGGRYPVWEGIGWVIDLLPGHPRRALDVLDAFFEVHFQHLTDNYLSGLFDSMAIIRQRYIVDPSRQPAAEASFAALEWRELELLCGVLYEHMGFEVEVTPPSGDRGVDVIATRETLGQRERVVVQAKRYGRKTPVKRDNLVHLLGVVDRHRATRGVLITTGPVQRGARDLQKEDPRVEVIDAHDLASLLAEHCGADWPSRIDRFIRTMAARGSTPRTCG